MYPPLLISIGGVGQKGVGKFFKILAECSLHPWSNLDSKDKHRLIKIYNKSNLLTRVTDNDNKSVQQYFIDMIFLEIVPSCH